MNRFWLGVWLLVASTLACTLTSDDSADSQPSGVVSLPQVAIVNPTDGQNFSVGDTVTVEAIATDTAGGITRVELLVNNVIVDSQPTENPQGEASFSALLDYRATVAQEVTLTVRPFRGTVPGNIAQVSIVVGGSSDTASDDVGGSQQQQTNNNNSSVTTNNPTCRARVDVNRLNFRAGPGVEYDILGVVTLGQEPTLNGRNSNDTWWQIRSAGTTGWISAAFTTQLGNCQSLQVASIPPTPTPAPTEEEDDGPNLIVERFTGEQTIDLSGGEVVASYILRIVNTGDEATGQFNVTILYPDDTPTLDYTIQGLDPGEVENIPNISATYTTPGTYRFEVLVDSSGNVTESNEGDNQLVLDIVVQN